MDEFFSNHFFIFDESNERTERKGEFAIDSVLASPFFTKSRTNLFFFNGKSRSSLGGILMVTLKHKVETD